jgi:hypothetical protein
LCYVTYISTYSHAFCFVLFSPGAKIVGGAVVLPVAVGLLAGAVGLAAGVAAVALPAYGTYKLAHKIHDKVRERKYHAQRRSRQS